MRDNRSTRRTPARIRVALAVGSALGVGVVVAAFGATRPDPTTQAKADGCGRDVAALFRKEEPTWVYVGDASSPAAGPPPAPQWAVGIADAQRAGQSAHPAGIDDPFSHDSFDFLVNVKPDAPSNLLLGTGNFAGAGEVEEAGRLHTEWEEAAFSSFAWPGPGDRVRLLGNWVWDCGHFGGGGERTELHPLRAVWVERRFSPRSPAGEAEGDLLISTDKTAAGAAADCAHETKGDHAAFKACLDADAGRQDVSGTYTFELRAPPRPSPAAKLRVRVVDAGSVNAPVVRVVAGVRGAKVTVAVSASPSRRVVVAKKVFAGWTGAARPVHLRVTFDRLLVRRAMDPGCPATSPDCASLETTRKGQITKPPGEWVLYASVAGVWSRWPLLRPVDGQMFRLGRSVDVYVDTRATWRLVVTGRECDNATLSAHSIVRPPSPCPAGTGEFLDLVGDDIPGTVTDTYRSPAAAVGTHASNAARDGSSCPPVNRLGCYRVVYRVAVAG